MARPAVNISSRESGPPRTSPTNTGRTYVVVKAQRGPTGVPYDVMSFEDYKRTYGDRLPSTSLYWDAVEAFYKYGGSGLTVIRADGGGVRATLNLDDAVVGSPFSLVATALGQGIWYNGINLTVEDDAGSRRIVVTHDTDPSVNESSPWASDQLALVDWSQRSRYIRLALGSSANLPAAVVNAALAGGTDDYVTITTTERVAALVGFDSDLGPGQVAIPGATTSTEWAGILAHALATDRDAILAYPDTADEATLVTLAETARTSGRAGAGFAPWLSEPGPAGLPKVVEPSLAVCGKISGWDADSNGLGQNKPVAGALRGVLTRCLGVTQNWTDEDQRTRLNAAGVNLIRQRPNGVTIFGWRSLADPVNDSDWINFGHRRLYTALVAKIDAIMEPFLFEEIDGEGTLFKRVQSAIVGRVLQPYFLVGSLYGATPQEAYRVDVDSVNTPETIANRELHAAATVVESEYAEEINIDLIKKMITQGVNA